MRAGYAVCNVDWSNIREVLMCDSLYDCPVLHKAGHDFLDQQVTHTTAEHAVATLSLLELYGSAASRAECVKWIAEHMADVIR